MATTYIYIDEKEWERDVVAEQKAREQRWYAYRDYNRDRAWWDSWEEQGYNTWCPSGNPDYIGRTMNNDMDDNYCIDSELDIEEKYRRKVEPVKKATMSEKRLAHRAELLNRYMARKA